ncbi:hypothetical protein HBI26_115800 [Parastagonospora nodorum]|nr:hypothetical protein HBI26_115800 [Parastagonospora nodorum]
MDDHSIEARVASLDRQYRMQKFHILQTGLKSQSAAKFVAIVNTSACTSDEVYTCNWQSYACSRTDPVTGKKPGSEAGRAKPLTRLTILRGAGEKEEAAYYQRRRHETIEE